MRPAAGWGLALATSFLALSCSPPEPAAAPARPPPSGPRPPGPPSPADLPRVYWRFFKGIEPGGLRFADGRLLPLSDGQAGKTPDQRLERPDIDDMFVDLYPGGAPAAAPPKGVDPGRVRLEALFLYMYGDCRKGEVTPRMRKVAWMPRRGGGSVSFTTVNGAADALEAVVADLEKLPASMTRYLVPDAGTYNCRVIAGTNRLSMHAYGAAIDISTKEADYWRWSGGEGAPWRNRIPIEIVQVFEKHGFVWGGRWSHFDTMHFEYRPELIPAAPVR